MKKIKILQAGDLHFDTPFKDLNKNIALISKEELLEVFSKIIDMSMENSVDILLLTGDIIEKTNKDTNEKTYEIVNARISYDYIPMVLLSNENSVSIMNKEKTKEKVVNLNDFQNALNEVNKRETMLSW